MIETHENFPSQIVGSIRRLFTVLFKNKKKSFVYQWMPTYLTSEH